ncbi:MAG: hypothetical protein P0Y56_02595 [Candidatus Andeanibacterium colombiense]|uniref:Lipoprotein n=1 Tax=Candidatus Andeanibacterium colombiense TaxID=3121345 RepID=A0AAJ5X667_9SPHN|nr:MAG: hypothetical protein P0Y56_02595 [Sphingomonadaceae bacterium]
MRWALLVLSAAPLALPTCLAAQTPDASYQSGKISKPVFPDDTRLSLVTGHLVTQHPQRSFPCPEQNICLDAVWDDTLADLKTQLGSAIDSSVHIRSVHDAGLVGNPILAYVVKQAGDGQLWAIDVRAVEHNWVCFDDWLADAWPELASDPRTTRSGDEVCLRLK